jgi:hypothetical protein
VISGLRHGARCTRDKVHRIREWILAITPAQRLRVVRLAVEYCNEAAVLVIVFPVLDVTVQKGLNQVTIPLVLWSTGISLALFGFAAILSLKEQ